MAGRNVARSVGSSAAGPIMIRHALTDPFPAGVREDARFLSKMVRVILVMVMVLLAPLHDARAAADVDVRRLQWDLIWTGQYEGTVDGRLGPAMRRAIRSYQSSTGAVVTGELSPMQREQLATQAAALQADVGWTIYEHPAVGYRIGYPAVILPVSRTLGANGQEFSSDDASALLATIVTGPDSEASFRDSYDRILADQAHRVVYKIWKPTWFVVSYVTGRSDYYIMFRRKPAATVSYVLSWPEDENTFFRPLATAIFNSFTVPDDVAP